MKKLLIIILLVIIMLFCGCTTQNPAVASETTAEETGKTPAPNTTITPVPSVNTITPTKAASTINPTAPLSIVTPNPQATFTLTKADYEKLQAPLMVLAIGSEYPPRTNYDLKNGLTREYIAHFVWHIAYAFDYFDPNTLRYSKYYNISIEKYGIRKGDLRLTGNKLYIPQKAVNSILMSTFGEKALKKINLNENIFEGTEGMPKELKDGVYIFGLGDDYSEGDFLGILDLPFKANELTEFKTSFKAIYGYDTQGVVPEIVDFSIVFQLRKDDSSEWGYNITAFNMQKDK